MGKQRRRQSKRELARLERKLILIRFNASPGVVELVINIRVNELEPAVRACNMPLAPIDRKLDHIEPGITR